MIIRKLISVGSEIDSGVIFGNKGNAAIIDRVNQQCQNGLSVFGTANDPFRDRAKAFNDIFIGMAKDVEHLLERTASHLFGRDVVIDICKEEDLAHVPEEMRFAILSHKPIQERFVNGELDGWGLNIEDVDDGMVNMFDRVISNGLWTPDPVTGVMPDTYEWEWRSSDPEYDMDELHDLMESRLFVDNFIMQQIDSGDMVDPTCYPGGKMASKVEIR